MAEFVLEARNITKYYPLKKEFLQKQRALRAVNQVSFALKPQETMAIVGESGCGKSTLARILTLIESPSSGQLYIDGHEVNKDNFKHDLRHQVQIILQNPYSSLNPRQRVGEALIEVLTIQQPQLSYHEKTARAREMLELVGLKPEHFMRFPHMFSGGQRQRIAIARALIGKPRILILDEPVSALDISIQAQILNLLQELQAKFALSMIFISHDLSVVRAISDHMIVMYLGQVVESGLVEDIYQNPAHPYTQGLITATPSIAPIMGMAPKKIFVPIIGEIPSASHPPSGCVFHPRCPQKMAQCTGEIPSLRPRFQQQAACFLS